MIVHKRWHHTHTVCKAHCVKPSHFWKNVTCEKCLALKPDLFVSKEFSALEYELVEAREREDKIMGELVRLQQENRALTNWNGAWRAAAEKWKRLACKTV